MKNKLFLLALFFVTSLQAQMVVKKTDGTVITDGQIFTYSSTIYSQALLGFYVQNTSTSDNIRIKIKCESITNANGVDMQLCFGGVCLNSITAGNSYPSGQPVIIAPGASTINAFDDFYNQNLGDGINYPMDYVFKFYQMDSSNVVIGNSITITYRYDPTLSTNGFELNSLNNMGITLKSTVINDVLEIDAKKATSVEIYNLNGKLVIKRALNAKLNTIDVSGFQSNMYLMNFSTDSGQRTTVKFIKK